MVILLYYFSERMFMQIREATLNDTEGIQLVEKDYYEGFSCDEHTLKSWIKTGNFFVAEENNEIIGFIYFEFLDNVLALPFVHKPITGEGKYVYVSEIGVINKDIKLMQKLFDFMLKIVKEKDCRAVVWVTGGKSKHDMLELEIIKNNHFIKKEKVTNWECYPGKFVSDHWIYLKEI